jgi:primosomal protein N' (replication factor Y)
VLRAQLQPGMRLRVPFGRREMIGILVEVTDTAKCRRKTQAGMALLDATPPLPPALFKLCLWTAQYYQHSLGDTLSWALPVLLRQGELAEARQERFWSTRPAPASMTRASPAPRASAKPWRPWPSTPRRGPSAAEQTDAEQRQPRPAAGQGPGAGRNPQARPGARHEHWLAQPDCRSTPNNAPLTKRFAPGSTVSTRSCWPASPAAARPKSICN